MPQKPMESRAETISPPVVNPSPDFGAVPANNIAVTIAQSQERWLRVLVRNVSPNGGDVFLAYDDAQSLQNVPIGSNVYVLPAGASDTFVLSPRQKLYAVTTTQGTRLTYAVSEALPIDRNV